MIAIFWALIFLIIAMLVIIILLLKRNFKPDFFYRSLWGIKEVGNYYDKYTQKYLEVVPSAIQSHRTFFERDMFDYYRRSMGIKNGMRLLDAGCGVCGPAVYFAKNNDIIIDAITNSGVQLELSNENINKEGVTQKVFVKKGDYHLLDEIYKQEHYNIVYFLESYGHACDPKKLLTAASRVLKSGGILYIKDYFKRDVINMKSVNKVSSKMNLKYFYNLPDLYYTIHVLRNLDFECIKVGTITFEHDMGVKSIEFEKNNDMDLFNAAGKTERFAYADFFELIFKKTIPGIK